MGQSGRGGGGAEGARPVAGMGSGGPLSRPRQPRIAARSGGAGCRRGVVPGALRGPARGAVGRRTRRRGRGIRAAAGDRRPDHELCRAAARRQCRRPRDRALLPDDARAHQRGRDRAAVLHARNQPARRCRARRQAGRPGAGALPAVAARCARDAAAPAQRRAGKAAAREIGRRPRRLGPAVRRDRSPNCAFRSAAAS